MHYETSRKIEFSSHFGGVERRGRGETMGFLLPLVFKWILDVERNLISERAREEWSINSFSIRSVAGSLYQS